MVFLPVTRDVKAITVPLRKQNTEKGFGRALNKLEGIILLLKIKVKSAVYGVKHTIS